MISVFPFNMFKSILLKDRKATSVFSRLLFGWATAVFSECFSQSRAKKQKKGKVPDRKLETSRIARNLSPRRRSPRRRARRYRRLSPRRRARPSRRRRARPRPPRRRPRSAKASPIRESHVFDRENALFCRRSRNLKDMFKHQNSSSQSRKEKT